MDPDEAKIRINQINIAVDLIGKIQTQAHDEIKVARGKVAGLKEAGAVAQRRFHETAAKYERHQRMAEEEEAVREELGKDQPTQTPTQPRESAGDGKSGSQKGKGGKAKSKKAPKRPKK